MAAFIILVGGEIFLGDIKQMNRRKIKFNYM